MRIEATEGDEWKVWLTDSEIEDLRRATNSQRDDLIIQLGAYAGLRAFEIPQARPVDVKQTESSLYRLRVQSGKDTSGNGGKPRDAYLPDRVERDLQRFQNEHNIAPKEPYIDLTQPGVRAVVRRTAERAAEATGEPDFEKVSTHDLRRRFAQRLLVDEQVNPRVVMAVGGWDSFAAMKPYLNSPSEDVIDEAMSDLENFRNAPSEGVIDEAFEDLMDLRNTDVCSVCLEGRHNSRDCPERDGQCEACGDFYRNYMGHLKQCPALN